MVEEGAGVGHEAEELGQGKPRQSFKQESSLGDPSGLEFGEWHTEECFFVLFLWQEYLGKHFQKL